MTVRHWLAFAAGVVAGIAAGTLGWAVLFWADDAWDD